MLFTVRSSRVSSPLYPCVVSMYVAAISLNPNSPVRKSCHGVGGPAGAAPRQRRYRSGSGNSSHRSRRWRWVCLHVVLDKRTFSNLGWDLGSSSSYNALFCDCRNPKLWAYRSAAPRWWTSLVKRRVRTKIHDEATLQNPCSEGRFALPTSFNRKLRWSELQVP
jgi:hypothetical protein